MIRGEMRVSDRRRSTSVRTVAGGSSTGSRPASLRRSRCEREAVAEFLVSEQAAAAVGVVNDGGLEVRPVGRLGLYQVANVRDVLDLGGSRAPTDRAGDDRLTELKAEKIRRVGSGVNARDHVKPLMREKR